MEQDSVDIQYIICECGDNFSSEKLLNIHLANGHEDVEVFQCESCSEIFTSENLFQQHQNEHKTQKLQAKKAKTEELKIHNRKQDAIKKERLEDFSTEDFHKSDVYNLKQKESKTRLLKTSTNKAPIASYSQPQVKNIPPLRKNNPLQLASVSSMKGSKGSVKAQYPVPSAKRKPDMKRETEVMETEIEELVIVKTEHEEETEEGYYSCDACSVIITSEKLFRQHQNLHRIRDLRKKYAVPDFIKQEQLDHSSMEDIQESNVHCKEPKHTEPIKQEPTQKELAVKDKPRIERLLKNNMKWMDSTSLMENLRVYSGVKAEPPESAEGLDAGETAECAAEETAEEVAEDVAEEVVVGDAEQDDEDIYYQCSVCRKIFASEEYFDSHYKRVHADIIDEIALAQDAEQTVKEEDEQPSEAEALEPDAAACEEPPPAGPEQVVYYKCDLCKTLYPSERAYNSHFSKKHGAKGFRFIEQDLERPPSPPAPQPGACFRCELCPKSFPLRRSLGLHRRRVHAARLGLPPPPPRAPARKTCHLCAREYSASNMVSHMRTHTGEKPYLCSECPKRFSMPQLLQIHLRVHTGETPYQCPLCPKAFKSKAASNRHDRVHTGVKPYACSHCGKSFSQSNSMKSHVKTVHLKIPAPYRPRRNKSERFGVHI